MNAFGDAFGIGGPFGRILRVAFLKEGGELVQGLGGIDIGQQVVGVEIRAVLECSRLGLRSRPSSSL